MGSPAVHGGEDVTTNLLNSGWSLDQVAERVNTSPQRIKLHYDFPDRDEQYRERRADLVDKLGIENDDSTTDSENDDS